MSPVGEKVPTAVAPVVDLEAPVGERPVVPPVDTADVPLVVDLDGTLVRTDMLLEGALGLVAERPLAAFELPLWWLRGPAVLKRRITDRHAIDPETLPFNAILLDFILEEREAGRKVYLASAADRQIAEAVAEHLGCFDGIFASDGQTNLKGEQKARLLVKTFGERGFDYAGDTDADLAVWAHARRAIAVDCSARVLSRLTDERRDRFVVGRRSARLLDYVTAIRVHQWAKNALIFLPALAAHQLGMTNVAVLCLAALSFSLVASAIYVINDLLDLANDRAHASKRLRPFAAGTIPLRHGFALAPGLLAAGISLATFVGSAFLSVMVLYLALTTAYSLKLKRVVLVDVFVLAGLYTMRILAGAVAVGVALSPWILGFSLFFFLCLALVKRYAELRAVATRAAADAATDAGGLAGRGYRAGDVDLIMGQACAAGYSAVVVLALYVNSPQVVQLYGRPEMLWGACALVLYWITRILLIAHRGQMHHDPIVFALRDRVSLLTVAVTGTVVGASAWL